MIGNRRPHGMAPAVRPVTEADQSPSGDVDPSGQPAIKVDGLTKRFGSGARAVTAVEDVSFSIDSGSIVGLLGPNGAGKTTTIKCTLGLVIPDSGTIAINGIDVAENPHEAHEHVEAMMEGARNQYWRLTVRENLRYFASIAGENPDDLRDRRDRLLDRLDLRKCADTQVRNLSRGMKQKVAIASTLARDISIVFLDEPTLGLDVESSISFRKKLRELVRERELTVLLSSHDMDVIEETCDRVIIMDDGEVIADDTVEELLEMFDTTGYRISVSDLNPSSIRELRTEVAVDDIVSLGNRARLEVTADSTGFYRLISILEKNDARILDVETKTPDLEDLFVAMTGRDSV